MTYSELSCIFKMFLILALFFIGFKLIVYLGDTFIGAGYGAFLWVGALAIAYFLTKGKDRLKK